MYTVRRLAENQSLAVIDPATAKLEPIPTIRPMVEVHTEPIFSIHIPGTIPLEIPDS